MTSRRSGAASTADLNGSFDASPRPKPDPDLVRRIGLAWVELRRGAGARALREYLVGPGSELEQGQMDALDLLARRDRKMRELAERLRIDASTATRSVDRLVEIELAERYPAPEDGRVVMVKLTPKGRRTHHGVAGRRSHAMNQILSEFAQDDCATFADLFDQFIASVESFVSDLD